MFNEIAAAEETLVSSMLSTHMTHNRNKPPVTMETGPMHSLKTITTSAISIPKMITKRLFKKKHVIYILSFIQYRFHIFFIKSSEELDWHFIFYICEFSCIRVLECNEIKNANCIVNLTKKKIENLTNCLTIKIPTIEIIDNMIRPYSAFSKKPGH